jgi:tRNA-splicing ligase RtcB
MALKTKYRFVKSSNGEIVSPIFNKDSVDEKTIIQFKNCIDEPYVRYAALMADGHLGYSAPIGSVLKTEEFIVPAWVGYDIGCGVITTSTDFNAKRVFDNRWAILDELRENIPMGFKHNKELIVHTAIDQMDTTKWFKKMFEEKEGGKQMCTLGGGNHFISIDMDHIEGKVWITIHSGSRGIGWQTARHYMTLAAGGTKAKEGNYPLSIKYPVGKDYLKDYEACITFASSNRKRLLFRAAASIRKVINSGMIGGTKNIIDCSHNYLEFTKTGIIHRKGAIGLAENQIGIIPANMRDGTFVVKGKGNSLALSSCSHGAGRAMSRKEAKKKIDPNTFVDQMGDIACWADQDTLDEAPDAYHDIQTVLDAQYDCLEIVNHLQPLIVAKG